MSFEHHQAIDLNCPNCFYSFRMGTQEMPPARLLAVQLQMNEVGADVECPRCKGYFLAINSPAPPYQRKTYFLNREANQVVSTTY